MTAQRHSPETGVRTLSETPRRPVRGAVATVAAALLVFTGCAATVPAVRHAAGTGVDATKPGTDLLPAEDVMASRGYLWNDLRARSSDSSSSTDACV